ncbi:MAG TPA: UDP-N-acetylmuramoyl-tripeptide--D-alanyl-D-alanine ligase [Motilibacteraceae bacterium]|nr:UDP-N-acetylmuramoyl-tripeptide--D-alanyl-D-alanine ligase [Motilibacteraceae bacterium]
MIPMTLAEIAEAVGGTLLGGPEAAAVVVTAPASVDSRSVQPGGLFVAVPGEHVDGHDFARGAVDAGAAAALVARADLDVAPAVRAEDTVAALQALGAAVRDRVAEGTLVVGITGSSGKTSTKDLLAAVLETAGETVATAGSYNNELGLPLTLTRVTPTTRHLVLEMGARHLGNIRELCELARPTVGVVLNVGSAHVGEFGSREAIAQTKGELVESLPAHGVAVLNADDPLVRAMAARTAARVVLVGESPEADVRAENVRLDGAARATFDLVTGGGRAEVRLRLHGEHHVANALSVAAVALEAGLSLEDTAAALSAAAPRSRWRMEVVERNDGVTVVNDAYNANPESMRAGLKALVNMAQGRRTWAVLGEMLELGDSSRDEHDAIGRLAVRLDVSRLVVVGQGARPMHLGAALEGSWGDESAWVPDADAALALLREELAPGDVVLVKASRAAGLEKVAEALISDAPSEATAAAAQGSGA